MQIEDENQALQAKILMQNCQPMKFDLGDLLASTLATEGWTSLGEGLQHHTGMVNMFYTKKSSLDNARVSDLLTLWNALSGSFQIEKANDDLESQCEVLEKGDGELAWARLCAIRDLSEEEWLAQI